MEVLLGFRHLVLGALGQACERPDVVGGHLAHRRQLVHVERADPVGEAGEQRSQLRLDRLQLAHRRLGGRVARVGRDGRVDVRAEDVEVGRDAVELGDHGVGDLPVALVRPTGLAAAHAVLVEQRDQPVHVCPGALVGVTERS
ncbi:hypothetical protein [Ilumatobacter sp.]|uniref:hypothetical protein n=1 Tax=Ilumatobacter sp. TaxID=1967498 RepID=UPI003B523469